VKLAALVSLVAVASGLWSAPAPAAASGEEARAERVVIVSYPRLSWETIANARPPVLSAFVERASVASLSIRTAAVGTGLGDGYVTIGAGNRASADPDIAGWAVSPGDVAGSSLGCGERPPEPAAPPPVAAVHLGATEIRRAADDALFGAEPGVLGDALAQAGRSAAVIGNADVDCPDGGLEPHREVALAGMDRDGRVASGRVDTGLAQADATAPGGRVMDVDAYLDAIDEAWPATGLLVVEMSDLERTDLAGPRAGTAERTAADAAALARSDEVLAAILGRATPRDLVMVVAPAAADDAAALTVFAAAGGGLPTGGEARSATTRRDGYVTLPDIAVTTVEALGLSVPDEMNGTAITSAGGDLNDHGAIGRLADADERARFRDRAVAPVSVVFTIAQVFVYGGAIALLWRRPSRRVPEWLAFAGLVVMATPVVGFLSGLVRYRALGLLGYTIAVPLVAIAVAAAAWATRRWHPLSPPVALAAVTLIVLSADVATGAGLQLDTVFGYSPTIAGRFAGFGNLAFALVASCAAVLAAGGTALGPWPPPSPAQPVRGARLWFAAAVLVVAIVADGLPGLGSDIGGVLALVPAAAIIVALLAHWRVNAVRVALVGAATVALVGVFAVFDLSRPEEDRTHLGRFVARVADGDIGLILRRKLVANWSILTSSVWTLLLPLVVLGLVLVARRDDPIGKLRARVVGVHAGLVGAGIAAVLGFALNDSGVAIPAMMLAIIVPWIIWLLAVKPETSE